MKTKYFIFVVTLCAIMLISPAEIEQSKDAGVTKEFKTDVVIDKDVGMRGGGHGGNHHGGLVDSDWGGGRGYGGGWEGGEHEGGCEGGEGEEGNDEGWGEVGGTEAGLRDENEGRVNGKPEERA